MSEKPISIRTQYSTSSTLIEPISSRLDGSGTDTIVRELQLRVIDWAGVSPSNFGGLRLHDTLLFRKGPQEKPFDVYLFEEAIICIGDKKKRKMFGSLGVFGTKTISASLCLKGRVFIRHIKQVNDTSTSDEYSLSIETNTGSIEAFTIVFADQWNMKRWQSELSAVLAQSRLK